MGIIGKSGVLNGWLGLRSRGTRDFSEARGKLGMNREPGGKHQTGKGPADTTVGEPGRGNVDRLKMGGEP